MIPFKIEATSSCGSLIIDLQGSEGRYVSGYAVGGARKDKNFQTSILFDKRVSSK